MEGTQHASVEGQRVAEDAVLCDRVRHGDGIAFTELYSRHYEKGIRYALRLVRDRQDAEDLLSEAFARTLDVLKRGKGPTESFQAYLNMVLRNLHIRAADSNTVALPDDADNYLPQLQEPDCNEELGERDLLYIAFSNLPERWQNVLWHLEVEGKDLTEVGSQLGMKPNAVAQLSLRARDGLKVAYLALHTEQMPSGECKAMAEKLARYVRNQAGKRDSIAAQKHLETCEDCRRTVKWMSDIGQRMRAVIAPLVLGGSGLGATTWALGSSSKAASALAPAAAGISGGTKLAIAGISVLAVTGAVFGGLALLSAPNAGSSPDATSVEPPRVVEQTAAPVVEEPVVQSPPEPTTEAVAEAVPQNDAPVEPETPPVPETADTPQQPDTPGTQDTGTDTDTAPPVKEDDTTPGWELEE